MKFSKTIAIKPSQMAAVLIPELHFSDIILANQKKTNENSARTWEIISTRSIGLAEQKTWHSCLMVSKELPRETPAQPSFISHTSRD